MLRFTIKSLDNVTQNNIRFRREIKRKAPRETKEIRQKKGNEKSQYQARFRENPHVPNANKCV